MKKRMAKIILILVFLTGLSLVLYPTISDYWNSFHQTRAIATYEKDLTDLDDEEYEEAWKTAQEYNKTLIGKKNRYILSDEERQTYESLLDIAGSGIMGYVEIPNINCKLPIYHGVDEAVLQVAIGHIEGTSLPVGGTDSHCVISGHRGLPSAKLFTDLDKLIEGDLFILQVLGKTLTYEVDKILIVEPDELEALEIESSKDYCTLMTCTPYGVNSHRLLVRGTRVENIDDTSTRIISEARLLDPVTMAPLVAAPILIILLVWLLVKYRK